MAIAVSIALNALVTAFDGPFVREEYGNGGTHHTLKVLNAVFTAIFALEMGIKIYAIGLRRYRSSLLNVFDGLNVVLSVLEIVLEATTSTRSTIFAAIKVFRLLRLFHLARTFAAFRQLMGQMAISVVMTFPMMIILLIIVFLYGVLSMHLFAGVFSGMYEGTCEVEDMGNRTNIYSEACARKPRTTSTTSASRS